MIKIEHTMTYGWEAAVRSIRNPNNSWDKSDSCFCPDEPRCEGNCPVYLGPTDLCLMKTRASIGEGDCGKFLRLITLNVDLTAPLYWWKEIDTYKVASVGDSDSSLPKIPDTKFTLDDFSHEHLWTTALLQLRELIQTLNVYWDAFNHPGAVNQYKKECRWQIIQLLPSSYNQKRTVRMSYAVLKDMYHVYKTASLDEWRTLCAWIETLPYSELITG